MLPVVLTKPCDMSAAHWEWLRALPFGGVLFSTQGGHQGVPLPMVCAAGDLDGDLYFLCWEPVILEHLIPRAEPTSTAAASGVGSSITSGQRDGVSTGATTGESNGSDVVGSTCSSSGDNVRIDGTDGDNTSSNNVNNDGGGIRSTSTRDLSSVDGVMRQKKVGAIRSQSKPGEGNDEKNSRATSSGICERLDSDGVSLKGDDDDSNNWVTKVQKYLVTNCMQEDSSLVGRLYSQMSKVHKESTLGMDDPDAQALANAYTAAIDRGKHSIDVLLPAHLRKKLGL